MAVIKNLDQNYIDHHLRCPDGGSELVDPLRTGLYVLVRATSPGEGTYYVRFKVNGKTRHVRVGGTRDLPLAEARASALALKPAHTNGVGAIVQPRVSVGPLMPGQAPLTSVPQADAQPPRDPGQSRGGMTLDAFMTDLYFPHAKVHKRSWKRDDQLYRLRIKPEFGDRVMGSITRREINQFKIALLTEGLAKASVNHHVQLMRHVFNLAVSWEALGRNVLTGIELLHLDNQRENYLNDAQVDGFLEVAKTDENRNVCMILVFLLSTGARLREALTARWDQVDRANKVWKIPATNTKSKKTKYLPLNDGAMWVIDQLQSGGKSPYLFPSPATGKPYTTITRAWYRIREKSGIADDVRIHDLRHTFASRVVSKGRSLFEAQRLLGHADPRTTMRYAHLAMGVMHEASNAAALAVV